MGVESLETRCWKKIQSLGAGGGRVYGHELTELAGSDISLTNRTLKKLVENGLIARRFDPSPPPGRPQTYFVLVHLGSDEPRAVARKVKGTKVAAATTTRVGKAGRAPRRVKIELSAEWVAELIRIQQTTGDPRLRRLFEVYRLMVVDGLTQCEACARQGMHENTALKHRELLVTEGPQAVADRYAAFLVANRNAAKVGPPLSTELHTLAEAQVSGLLEFLRHGPPQPLAALCRALLLMAGHLQDELPEGLRGTSLTQAQACEFAGTSPSSVLRHRARFLVELGAGPDAAIAAFARRNRRAAGGVERLAPTAPAVS